MSAIRHLSIVIVMGLGAMALGGCGDEPTVTSYEIPKEYGEATLFWELPEGWMAEPVSLNERAFNFRIEDKEHGYMGKMVAMNVGPAAKLLEVAKMIVSGLVQDEEFEADLAEKIEKKKLGGFVFEIGDLPMLDENLLGPQSATTLALLPGERDAWLFAMLTEDSFAKQQRPKFEKFLGSLTVLVSKEKPPEAPFENAPFAHPPVGMNEGSPFPSPTVEPPKWEVPEGWEEKAISGPRVASFVVKGEGEAELDVAVTRFPGSMGGPLLNLNRWRGQLKLEDVEEAQFAEHATEREVGGRPAHLVNLTNGDRGMLAVMILNEELSWFVKATGPTDLVESQKANFKAFLDSIRFPVP